jgi:hypothetical protein
LHQDAINDLQENAPRGIKAFEESIYACGAQRVEDIQLDAASDSSKEEGPVGLVNINVVFAVTTADIPANSLILQVPAFMILSSHHGAVEELRSWICKSLNDAFKFQRRPSIKTLPPHAQILVEYEKRS